MFFQLAIQCHKLIWPGHRITMVEVGFLAIKIFQNIYIIYMKRYLGAFPVPTKTKYLIDITCLLLTCVDRYRSSHHLNSGLSQQLFYTIPRETSNFQSTSTIFPISKLKFIFQVYEYIEIWFDLIWIILSRKTRHVLWSPKYEKVYKHVIMNIIQIIVYQLRYFIWPMSK